MWKNKKIRHRGRLAGQGSNAELEQEEATSVQKQLLYQQGDLPSAEVMQHTEAAVARHISPVANELEAG